MVWEERPLRKTKGNPVTGLGRLLAVFLTSLLVLQSFAALATPCLIPSGEGSTMMNMASADHSGHHMPSEDASAGMQAAADCCDGGYCSQNGCVSLSLLIHSSNVFPVVAPDYHSRAFQTATPRRSPSSLFRPPSA